MKRLSVLVASALVFGLTFTACSSDEDSTPASIVGKWNNSKEMYNVGGQNFPEVAYDDHETGCAKDYLEFAEDGTWTIGDYYDTDCSLSTNSGSYVQDGKTLTWENGNTTVIKVSGSTLKLKTTETMDGMTMTTTETFTKFE